MQLFFSASKNARRLDCPNFVVPVHLGRANGIILVGHSHERLDATCLPSSKLQEPHLPIGGETQMEAEKGGLESAPKPLLNILASGPKPVGLSDLRKTAAHYNNGKRAALDRWIYGL